MDLNTLFQSKKFKVTVLFLMGLVFIFAVFEAGLIVGYKKGMYVYRWQEHYEQNFGGPQGSLPFGGLRADPVSVLRRLPVGDGMGAHGISGTILKIDGATVVIRGRNDIESVVQLDDDSVIKRFHDTIHIPDLKVNDTVVVIGNPDEAGEIEAKFIRVMPSAMFQGGKKK